MFLCRQKATVAEKALRGDMIILTCIGLTTEPLRRFLEDCMEDAYAQNSSRTTAHRTLKHSMGKRQNGTTRWNDTNQKEE
jgi:hypothetical protein